MYESIYPWDRWTDGQAYMVRQGHDFTCYGHSMASGLHVHGSRIGMAVTTSLFAYDYNNDVVFFQFYDSSSLWKPNLKALPAWRKEKERHRKQGRSNGTA
jgi:hypothetical protein